MNGAKTPDIVAMTRFMMLSLGASMSARFSRSSCWETTSNTSPTWVPMTTWNCPPLSTTVMTPGSCEIFSLASAGVCFSTSRRRVAQRLAWLMLESPPTISMMFLASCG